jgi:hypothetical protein
MVELRSCLLALKNPRLFTNTNQWTIRLATVQ